MKQLYLLLTIGISLTWFAGAGLLLYPRLKSFALSMMTSLMTLVLGLYFVEHFVGLGSLHGWMLPAWLLALAVVWWRKPYWQDASSEAGAFVLSFGWALGWRFVFPNLDGGTEKLMNLSFINSYRSGSVLPPDDVWLSGHALDIYYGLQHYAAGLLGRLLGLSPGYNYHFAFAIAIGLIGMVAWASMRQWVLHEAADGPVDESKGWWQRASIVFALVAGGTGVAPLGRIIFPHMDSISRSWANVRFIGLYENQAGEWARQYLFTPSGEGKFDYPLEVLGYFMHIGDFHAVLGGFLLGMMLCLLFAYQVRHGFQVSKIVPVWMGAVLVLPVAMNMWILPPVFILLAGFAWVYRSQLRGQWLSMAVGVVAVTLLLQPFMSYFLPNSQGVGIALVKADKHTPLMQFLLVMWPMLALMVLGWLAKDKTGYLKVLVIFALFVLVFTELFVFDEFHNGDPARFNTLLKWWSWTFMVALVGIGGRLVVSAPKPWLRWGAVAVAVLLSVHSLDLFQSAYKMNREHWGKLSGDAWIPWWQKNLLVELKGAPKGKVLENVGYEAYVPQSGIALLAEQPSLIGWSSHEMLWRGNPEYINRMRENIEKFYAGDLANAQEWLLHEQVRYILVTDRKPMDAATQQKIHAQIGAAYGWKEMHDQPLIGIWTRK